MTEKAIQIIQQTDFATLSQMADIATQSTYVKANKAQAMFIMLKGVELGLSPLQALDGINIIQGKPTISPQLMLALINRSGELEDMKIDSTETLCTVTMKRKGRSAHTETFSLEDAKKMQLMEKDNYKKQPKTMMKWRAVSACARIAFPDVIQGVYTPEEMGAEVAEDDSGDVVVIAPQEPLPGVAVEPVTISKVEPQQPAQITATTPASVTDAGPTTTPPAVTTTAQPPPSFTAPYKLHELYNAVLKTEYDNNLIHMKKSIQLLINDGKLTDAMTLTEAVEVVKGRKLGEQADEPQQGPNPFGSAPTPPANPDFDALPSTRDPLFGAQVATGGTQALHAAAEYAPPVPAGVVDFAK